MWNYIEKDGTKYRYKSTEWAGKCSPTSHATIHVEYYREQYGWQPSINWQTIDYCIELRNKND